MKEKGKVVFIGLDGVPFEMIEGLSDTGIMPNIGRLIYQGIFKKMRSSIPEVSSVAWSSIITGRNPGEHGIFGFTDIHPGSYTLRFPNFNDLKSPPLWNTHAWRSIIINVPSTYPVKEMNGVHISGFVSIDLKKSVYPASLVSTLKDFDYRLDVDSQKAHQSLELFIADLDKTLEARIRTYRYLWKNEEWRFFLLVFTGTDRLMHFLWDAYQDKSHKHHGNFLRHFQKIDEIIGEIESLLNDEDLLIIASDHGFEKLDRDVYINYLLKKEGFLQFKENKESELGHIDFSSKAFALDPARVYLNLKGKYPCGGVQKSDSENILRDLGSLFKSLEIDNKKVIRDIYRKEEIYTGPFLEQAPDMILVSNPGFNLKANIKTEILSDKAIFTGKHTQDNAFLLVAGAFNTGGIPDKPAVADVRSIIETNILV